MSKIRKSANGEECQVRIIGVCKGDPAYTIWSHARHGAAGKGKGIKALDVAGAGRKPKPNKPKTLSWRPDSQARRGFYISMGGAPWIKALINAERERQENGK